MTSLEDFGPNTFVTVRIYKRWITNPSRVWANNYEFRSTAPESGTTSVIGLIDAVATVEEQIHLANVQLDRGVCSTLLPDGVPYDPATFIVRDLSDYIGNRPSGGFEPLDIKSTLFARMETALGRPGRRYYRGVLTEGDVNATASGEYNNLGIDAQTSISAALNDLTSASFQGTGWELVVAKPVGGSQQWRPITNISTTQVLSRQLRRRTRRQFGPIGGAPLPS